MDIAGSRPRSMLRSAIIFSSSSLRRSSKRLRGGECSVPVFSIRPRLHKSVPIPHQSSGTQCHAAPPESETLPFFEPLVRCFLLGVIFGGLFESYTVLATMADLSAQSVNVWNTVKTVHAPEFVEDHVLALLLWMVLYATESASVQPSNGLQTNSVQNFLAQIPKALLPLDFSAFKQFWLRISNRAQTGQMASTATATVLEAPSVVHGRSDIIEQVAPGTDAAVAEAPFVDERMPRAGLKPGQWDPAIGGVAQGEIANQVYMEAMYYCVGLVPTDGLKEGKVHSTNAMGTRLAYWKGADGAINTISSTCTHRGAQLVNGWIDEVNGKTCVRCPYHAWAFSGDGVVQDIPVQPEGGWPKRPLQQTFEVQIKAGKLWLFWGRHQIPKEERPPVPGTPELGLESMVSCHVSKLCEVPHQATMETLLSDDSIRTAARVFLGVTDCDLSAGAVESSWSARMAVYTMIPQATCISPLLPGRLRQRDIQVKVSAQLPSSTIITFDIGESRCLVVEAHVHPESYSTSRLTMTAHRNFSTWATSSPFVRDMLETVAEGHRGRAEGVPVKHIPDINPFSPLHSRKCCGILFKSFTELRTEFNALGYGIPAEIAAAPHKVDM